MYRFVLVEFPFVDEPEKTKLRPALMLSAKPMGKHKIIILAYITTSMAEVLDIDVTLSKNDRGFSTTGLLHDSVIKLYKLTSVEAASIRGELGRPPKAVETEVKEKLGKLFGF